jgi:peroxiredoxin
MRTWIASAFAAAIVGVTALPAAAQAPSQTLTKELGVAVGSQAPLIAGTTQDGRPAAFADLKGEKGLVIAFVRSADWCPFCRQQLKDLNTISDDLDARGFKLAALSYDSVEKLAKFARSNKIAYTLLSDPRSSVIDAFGLRNLEVAGNKRFDGIPHPAIYIIAADGMILDKLYEESYRKRPPTDLVVKTVDKAVQKAPRS